MINSIRLTFPLLNSLKDKLFYLSCLMVMLSLFLIFYNPFEFTGAQNNSLSYTITSSLVIAIFFSLIAAITLFLYKGKINKRRFTIIDYFVMVLINVLITSVIFSFGSNNIAEYIESSLILGAIVLIPYVLTTSFCYSRYLVSELVEKKAKLALIARDIKLEMIEFTDEYGKVGFVLERDSILYIEANDNYVNIYFFASSRVSYKIIRASMKLIESIVAPYDIIRCHRSYMVNTNKINFMQKERGKFKLNLCEGDFLVPVSAGFATAITNKIGISPLKG